jgi:hypothetical protein
MHKLIILGCEHKDIINRYNKDKGNRGVKLKASNKVLGSKMIIRKLKELVKANKLIF